MQEIQPIQLNRDGVFRININNRGGIHAQEEGLNNENQDVDIE